GTATVAQFRLEVRHTTIRRGEQVNVQVVVTNRTRSWLATDDCVSVFRVYAALRLPSNPLNVPPPTPGPQICMGQALAIGPGHSYALATFATTNRKPGRYLLGLQ